MRRVLILHLLQDMGSKGSRHGQRKPMDGMPHHRVEQSLRTMVNFTDLKTDRLGQVMYMYYPYTWFRDSEPQGQRTRLYFSVRLILFFSFLYEFSLAAFCLFGQLFCFQVY